MYKLLLYTAIATAALWLEKNTNSVNPLEDHKNIMRQDSLPETPLIDYAAFREMTDSYQGHRRSRKVDMNTFMEYAQDSKTIILDTRSAKAFAHTHLKGATHLNFSDFTEERLKQVIPSKSTRILIYCNNNFDANDPKRIASLVAKSPPLALNIPTYINLMGYGYKNVYELESLLPLDHPMLEIDQSADY